QSTNRLSMPTPPTDIAPAIRNRTPPPTTSRPPIRPNDMSTHPECQCLEAIQLAGSMQTLQLMDPGIFKGQPGAVKQIHDRCRHQDLVCAGHGHDPRCRVDRDPAQIVSRHLDFSGMDAGPNLKA